MRHLQTLELIVDVSRAGSIRKAAEDLNITASALNRRIQQFEAEFGAQIFERLPRGVRLNPAGEILIQHIRTQRSDLARVQSVVADLAGVRRGHVSIACSQALLPYFLPREIARYRAEFPGVSFSLAVRDRAAAEQELSEFSSDLALVFEPMHLADFEVLGSIPQPVCAVMARDHPLSGAGPVRLRDCLDHPHVAPGKAYGVRHLLDLALRRSSRSLKPVVEAESFEFMRYYVQHEGAIAFQIPIGLDESAASDVCVRPIAAQDMPAGHLLLGQLRGRPLPVASSRFAQQLLSALMAMALEEGGAPMTSPDASEEHAP